MYIFTWLVLLKIDLSLISLENERKMNYIQKYTCNPRQLGGMIMKLHSHKTPPIIDYVRETNDKKNYEEIKHKIITYPCNHFAIKLSALGVDVCEDTCAKQLESLIHLATQVESKVLIDAEQHDLQEKIDAFADYSMEKFNQHEVVVYKTYQMYKKEANEKLMEDLTAPRSYFMGIKLVRGAYLKQDQPLGVLCNTENETHHQYDQGIKDFVKHHMIGDELLCATHNPRSVYLAKHLIRQHQLQNISFAQLLGMSDYMTQDLQAHGYKAYKYLPYGEFRESIPYLLRRLYENYPMTQYMDTNLF